MQSGAWLPVSNTVKTAQSAGWYRRIKRCATAGTVIKINSNSRLTLNCLASSARADTGSFIQSIIVRKRPISFTGSFRTILRTDEGSGR